MEHEYYMLDKKYNHEKASGSFGSLKFKDREGQEELYYHSLNYNNKIGNIDRPIEFSFDIRAGGATLGDYHEEFHYKIMVFHSKIIKLLQSINIPNIEYLPARIYKHKPKGAFTDDYTILNPFNKIDCLDKEKSKWKAGFSGEVVGIDSLVLNAKSLENIPLEERLIFRIDEKPKRILFHKSIAEKINGMDTKGCYLYDLATWRSGTFYLHGFGDKYANR